MTRPSLCRTLLPLVSLGLLFGGCAGMVTRMARQHREQILARAEFDLRCPRGQIKLVSLDRGVENEELSDMFGADGCGDRAVYVRHWNSRLWLRDDGRAPQR